jgi:hypothetical protein
MARHLVLVCVLAVCSAASARLLLQTPAFPDNASSTTPAELDSPGPIVAALPVNETAVVPAILVPVTNTSDGAFSTTDGGNATVPTFATFADAVAAANSTAANLTILVALIDAAGRYSSLQQTVADANPARCL